MREVNREGPGRISFSDHFRFVIFLTLQLRTEAFFFFYKCFFKGNFFVVTVYVPREI